MKFTTLAFFALTATLSSAYVLPGIDWTSDSKRSAIVTPGVDFDETGASTKRHADAYVVPGATYDGDTLETRDAEAYVVVGAGYEPPVDE